MAQSKSYDIIIAMCSVSIGYTALYTIATWLWWYCH